MDLRFFALVHKYSLVLDSIRIENVIFFRFFLGGGGPPLSIASVVGIEYRRDIVGKYRCHIVGFSCMIS